jgi:cell division septation protein DedD
MMSACWLDERAFAPEVGKEGPMSAQSEKLEQAELEEEAPHEQDFEEFDDDEEERGLSGLVVLIMGVVMLGAFASIVWIAYWQGTQNGPLKSASAPYVAADPEPLKIENQTAELGGNDRAVYDRIEGNSTEPGELLASASEEPVSRTAEDPIAAIVADTAAASGVTDDAVNDRINQLAAADRAAFGENQTPATPERPTAPPIEAVANRPIHAQPVSLPAPAPASVNAAALTGSALSGSHLVQIGAFGSQGEAEGVWVRVQNKIGALAAGKSTDIQRADLGEKGVFYRLRIGPFASQADAKSYCESLKGLGQDCLVKAK